MAGWLAGCMSELRRDSAHVIKSQRCSQSASLSDVSEGGAKEVGAMHGFTCLLMNLWWW